MGPPVSKLKANGTMPLRLSRPWVGLRPTIPLAEEGPRIDPPVSVPIPNWAKAAAMAEPVPPLEPDGVRWRSWGFRVCRPIELKPWGIAPLAAIAGGAPAVLPPPPAHSLRL